MKKLLSLGVAVGFMLAACAAFAAPTLAGMTGNGVLPTAAVAPAGAIEIAADYYDTDTEITYPIRALIGVSDKMEIGAGYTVLQDLNSWNVNAKFVISQMDNLAIAIGGRYSQVDNAVDSIFTDAYLVGTNKFPLGDETSSLNATIGATWEQQQQTGSPDVDGIRGLIGLEANFMDKLCISAEYQTKKDELESDALMAVTARYPLTNMIGIQVGWTNASPFGLNGLNDSNIFAGLNIKFGATTEEEEY